MITRKTGLLAAAVCLAGASAGLAATEVHGPFTFSSLTDWTKDFDVPQFDDMGGTRTLTQVKYTYTLAMAFDGTVRNDNANTTDIDVSVEGEMSLVAPGVNESFSPSDMQAFMAVPGQTAEPNPGGIPARTRAITPVNEMQSDMVVIVAPATLAMYVGAGFVDADAEAEGLSECTGGGNLLCQIMTSAEVEFEVEYTYEGEEEDCPPPDCGVENDECPGFGPEGQCLENKFDFELCGKYIDGTLEKRLELLCEPDTYLVLFNKQGVIINRDDNGSSKGNGWASGLEDVVEYDGTPGSPFGDGEDGFIDNGDGTFSIRIGVTGRGDGLDGNFNGFFMNAPHGQLGKFTLCVLFTDSAGDPVPGVLPNGDPIDNPSFYTDEFITGAEAFHINYTLPLGTQEVDINIDNSVPCDELRNDVDFYCICGLVPLCDYCITQIGGINCECLPTATCLGWFDKDCELITSASDNGEIVPEFAKLLVIADVNGKALIAVSGSKDCDFDGLDDAPGGEARAPIECPEPTPGHGEAGCYTLCIEVTGAHAGGETEGDEGSSGDAAAMQQALDHGDLNMDGLTNTADLGILLGSFGWTAP